MFDYQDFRAIVARIEQEFTDEDVEFLRECGIAEPESEEVAS